MSVEQTRIRVIYAYGASDRSGEPRHEKIREGLRRVGLVAEADEYFVLDWGRFMVSPRDEDRQALLDNRFGATDAEARALVAAAINANLRSKGKLVEFGAREIEKLVDIPRGFRAGADGAYPVIVDVFGYMRHTDLILDHMKPYFEELVAQSTLPVIVIGLSLGGIICVDALSRWSEVHPTEARRALKLLVTVGSQSPMLYALDALRWVRRQGVDRYRPFTPWLNIWRRLDLLSFPARPMFAAEFPDLDDLRDVALDPGDNPELFPQAHSTYFDDRHVYEAIRKMLVDLRVVGATAGPRMTAKYPDRIDLIAEAASTGGAARPARGQARPFGSVVEAGATIIRI
jgi:hypothetical protein